MEEIHLSSQLLFHLGPIPVTNSILATWFGMAVIIATSALATKQMSLIPSGIQNIAEIIIEALFKLVDQITLDRSKTLQFFPYLATFFLFILVLNWTELIPGFGSILAHTSAGEVPLLRSANTDLNTPLALALISVLGTQILGIQAIGLSKHLHHYFNFKPTFEGVINTFVGLLHILSEVGRIISFTFRLFGNIFAGEVLLIVISYLIPYIMPVPFYAMELFVGLIQALVFTMLTLVFATNATSHQAEGTSH
jgi:F-type H+-transporting ATPase subunit a